MTKYLKTRPGSIEETIEKLAIQEADANTMLVVNPAKKKPGVDGVKRIPKEKWPEYQKQGYIQAEEVQAEELKGNQVKLDKNKNGKLDADDFKKLRKEEELTAAQKKLPPALKKAIEKKEKNEEASLEEADDKRKDDPCWKDYKMVGMKKKNGKDVPNCVPKEDTTSDKQNASQKEKDGEKDFVKKAAAGKSDIINEGGMKEIDTNKKELERLNIRLSNLRDRKNSAGGADTTSIEKEIKQVQMSVIDLKKKLSSKNEEIETVEEAAGPDRLTNLNDKISRLQVNLQKLDKSKPDSKTKEAILKSDLTTAKLRLQDVMKKKASEDTTQAKVKVESKMNYKSMKKKLKTEKTLTGQPKTKIDTDPKIN
jgi:hypothetical protein